MTEIDGPLANRPTHSPADSDVTRIQWDPQGNHVTGWARMTHQALDAGLKIDLDKIAPFPTGKPVLHDPSKNIAYGDPNKWEPPTPPRPIRIPKRPPPPFHTWDRQKTGPSQAW